MPIIPLITRSAPLPNAPDAVLDNQRRPTVDNSQVSQRVGQLAESGKLEPLPAKALAAPYEALGAVGRAVMETGSVLGALQQKVIEAETYTQVGEANAKIDAAYIEANTYLETHPGKTVEEYDQYFQKRMTDLRAEISSNKTLHRGAAEKIDMLFTRAIGVNGAQIRRNAAIDAFGRAKQETYKAAQVAIENGDAPRLKAIFNESGPKGGGWTTENDEKIAEIRLKESVERKEREAKAANFRQAEDYALRLTDTQGPEPALEYIKTSKLDPSDKEALRNRVQETARDRKQSLLNELDEGIWGGSIKSVADLDASYSKDDWRFSPKLRAQVGKEIAERKEFVYAFDRQMNGKRNFLELAPRVRSYDPLDDPDDGKYWDLKQELRRRVGEAEGGSLLRELDARRTGKREAPKEVKGYIEATLGQMFDDKTGLIPWRTEVPVLDSKGRVVKDADGNPKTEWKEDPSAQAAATRAEYELQRKMREWMETSPKEAQTIEAAKKKLEQLKPEGMSNKALDVFQRKLRGTVEGATSALGRDPFQGELGVLPALPALLPEDR